MRDPLEGVTAGGLITTGTARSNVPPAFEPVLAAATDWVLGRCPSAMLYLYGSVATGQAILRTSDVDLLAIDLGADLARELSDGLTVRFESVCRSVEVGAAEASDLTGDGDEAYGFRVFLRHYCVPLVGETTHAATPGYPGDRRAARGFNGDIEQHLGRWRARHRAGDDAAVLGTRIARKTLLAVAGLVSVHDGTWTTDRDRAAVRWGEIDPNRADELRTLGRWARREELTDRADVAWALDAVVPPLVDRFEREIGLWR